MNRSLKIFLKIISSVMLGIVLLLALLLVGVRIFGVNILTVLSPSMEPEYPTGSLIYIVSVDPAKLEIDDVITYRISKDTTATHRIKEIVQDENNPDLVRFRTKGDNNDTYDASLVGFEQVEGKVVFCIPFLGYVAQYIQHPPGTYIAAGIGVAVIFFVTIVDVLTDDKDKKKTRNKTKNKTHKGDFENETI